jgi:hypothetical protein
LKIVFSFSRERRAEIRRSLSPRGVKITVQDEPSIRPIASCRNSPGRFEGIDMTGPFHRAAAASRLMPCLASLLALLAGSHSNFTFETVCSFSKGASSLLPQPTRRKWLEGDRENHRPLTTPLATVRLFTEATTVSSQSEIP